MGLGTSCVFKSVSSEQESECSIPPWGAVWHTDLRARQACAAPAAPVSFGLGLGAQACSVLSMGCLSRIGSVAGAAPPALLSAHVHLPMPGR